MGETMKIHRSLAASLRIVTIALLLAYTNVNADENWQTSTIKSVYPLGSGTSFVIVLQNPTTSCTNASNYHYAQVGQNGVTAEGLKLLYAAALAAHLSGRSISINFDGSTDNCFVNRLYVRES